MKTKLTSLLLAVLSGLNISVISAQTLANIEPYSAPAYWVENFTHEDQSISRVLVFQSFPGVAYTVETSHDLTQWTKGQTFYGLGQEIAVPMIQTAAPPVSSTPPNPNGPAPTPSVSKIVSLILRPTASQGIVISWLSLDTQAPVEHHFSSLTMDQAWNENLYYMKQYGSHYFCISHPFSTAVAKTNITHGPLDAALVTSFEANFSTMNAEVAASVERARLNPFAPAPSDPNSRKFFRIVANWGLDSDFDLSPDWLEFMGLMGIDGMVGSTTAVDANGDPFQVVSDPYGAATTPSGQAAGALIDTDGDGIADGEDMHPTSKFWNKKKISVRFAVMEVDIPESEEETIATQVLQTNGKGQVLFPKAVWQNGATQTLSVGSFTSAFALAMNDKGEILGSANDDAVPFDGLCLWASRTAAPQWISTSGTGNNLIYATLSDSSFYGSFGGADLFTDTRRFCAAGKEIEPGANPEDSPSVNWHPQAEWKTSASGQVTQTQTDLGSIFVHDAAYIWGYPDEDDDTTLNGKKLKNEVIRLVKLDESRLLAFSGRPLMEVHSMIDNDKWAKEASLPSALDASATGIVALFPSSTWLNNKQYALDQIAPEIGEVWKNGTAWHDVSPKGHMLLLKTVSDQNSVTGTTPEKAALAFPFVVEDNTFATGVDDQSVLATPSETNANGYQPKLWVMAPQGSWSDSSGTYNNSNAFTIKVPLDIATMNMTFEHATATASSLTGNSTSLEISGTGSETKDGKITFAMSGRDALSYPIGVKSMKKRTVKVRVYPLKISPQSPNTLLPTKQELEEELNEIFGKQINAYFDVTTEGQQTLNFDLAPSGIVDQAMSNYQEATYLMGQCPKGDHDVVLYLLSDSLYEANQPGTVGGKYPGYDACFILAQNHPTIPQGAAQVLRTIAHEIGHCLLDNGGIGHPDELQGPAHLPGTDVTKRLMCSGNNRRADGTLLVKKEWDEAEKWLKKNLDDIEE